MRYSLTTYPFPTLVASDVCPGRSAVDSLASLPREDTRTQRWTRKTDQSSVWHERFYRGFPLWREVYDTFVAREIAPLFGEPIYYQHVPTFRVHLTGNVAVGEFHTDRQYHHPVGEVTFWVPLTPAYETNSVWIEDGAGALRPAVVAPGQIAVFDAVHRRHGNHLNETGRDRVSFDFRCLPVRLLRDGDERSVNAGLRFAPGEYYHRDPVAA